MLKRDIADQLYSKAIKRFREENPEKELTHQQLDAIWYSIYWVLRHEGEEAARKYVETADLYHCTEK
ncbi:hypothetical protein LKD70_03905 [Ruminococcus sp. CLA-AA-H200]|uniref:Uncharacterized protein n=1 Tax=Ruminococcus turbiniformis TaxID=2881258 RepID=A0ABS8FW60_9FIRM|nr:hypothetical protein [Ruminococcus turbiniformis]MCC2253588.1 hypothetical protein [Ruminococcus turbiniformis]